MRCFRNRLALRWLLSPRWLFCVQCAIFIFHRHEIFTFNLSHLKHSQRLKCDPGAGQSMERGAWSSCCYSYQSSNGTVEVERKSPGWGEPWLRVKGATVMLLKRRNGGIKRGKLCSNLSRFLPYGVPHDTSQNSPGAFGCGGSSN